MPYIEYQTGDEAKLVELRGRPVTIGRQSANVLSFRDERLSRQHAVIEKGDGGYIVRDLGSRNGTAVNGQVMTGAVPLAHGDVIRAGSQSFRYYKVLPTKLSPARPTKLQKPMLIGSPPADEALQVSSDYDRPPDEFVADSMTGLADLAGQDQPTFSTGDAAYAGDDHGVDRPRTVAPTPPPERSSSANASAKRSTGTTGNAGASTTAGPSESAPPPRWESGLSGESDGVAPARQLAELADSLPVQPFGLNDIDLVNTRGEVVHAAGGTARELPAEAVTILRLSLLCCFRTRASDIHVEPKGDKYQIRIRADGTMVTIATLRKDLGVRFLSLIKILCDIDIAQRSAVQEGNFIARVPDRKVDYRVSMTPSIFGQKLVIRCLDSANAPRYLWDLDLPDTVFRTIEKAIKRDAGMLLVCGPTGSGKTSTLYSVLRSIDASERNVVTIEDPVEIQIDGVTQMPVNDSAGNTFASLLRSTLRQDPDVILVGEIRDAETARTAMQAAVTGHLVFSTVHSRDTVGSVSRLLDLGIEPFLIASGLNLLLAQRLVRLLCPYCKQAATPTDEQLREMGVNPADVGQVFRATGCAKCLGTGYSGRRGVFELMVVDDQVRSAITRNSPGDILAALQRNRFVNLKQNGMSLVAQGLTTLDEIDRVVGD